MNTSKLKYKLLRIFINICILGNLINLIHGILDNNLFFTLFGGLGLLCGFSWLEDVDKQYK